MDDSFYWRLKQDSTLGLRSSVSRGFDSPPDCHSLPLPFESIKEQQKNTDTRLGICIFWRLKQDSNL